MTEIRQEAGEAQRAQQDDRLSSLHLTLAAAIFVTQPLLPLAATEVGSRVEAQPHYAVSLNLGTLLYLSQVGASCVVMLHGATPHAVRALACK